jgi:hypothetical protein
MEPQDPGAALDSRLLLLDPADNVAAAARTIEAGSRLRIAGREIAAAQTIPTGHKVAVRALAAGDKVVKHGAAIGTATRAIRPGDYVHTHNLQSDYLPTYTLDGTSPYLKPAENQ